MLRRCLGGHNAIRSQRTVTPYRRTARLASSRPKPSPPPPSPESNTHKPPLSRFGLLLSKDFLRQFTFYSLAALLVFHIETTYFYSYLPCYGISMLPTINSFGDWVLISSYYRRGRGVQVGDLVSFRHPLDEDASAIKRIIGLDGDFVMRDTPGVGEGVMMRVPQGHCWLVGDNLGHSRDSRLWGPLPLALVKGKVIAIFSPWCRPRWAENTLQPVPEEDDID